MMIFDAFGNTNDIKVRAAARKQLRGEKLYGNLTDMR